MKSGDENLGKRWSDMDAVPPLLELPNSGEEVQAGQRKNLAIVSGIGVLFLVALGGFLNKFQCDKLGMTCTC